MVKVVWLARWLGLTNRPQLSDKSCVAASVMAMIMVSAVYVKQLMKSLERRILRDR